MPEKLEENPGTLPFFGSGQSDDNRRAKFYELTPAGPRKRPRETKEWHQTADLIAAFLTRKKEA